MKTPDEPVKMTASPVRTKMVRVKILRETTLSNSPNSQIYKPGDEVEVTEEQAKELCRSRPGVYSFSGERSTHDASRTDLRKAVLA